MEDSGSSSSKKEQTLVVDEEKQKSTSTMTPNADIQHEQLHSKHQPEDRVIESGDGNSTVQEKDSIVTGESNNNNGNLNHDEASLAQSSTNPIREDVTEDDKASLVNPSAKNSSQSKNNNKTKKKKEMPSILANMKRAKEQAVSKVQTEMKNKRSESSSSKVNDTTNNVAEAISVVDSSSNNSSDNRPRSFRKNNRKKEMPTILANMKRAQEQAVMKVQTEMNKQLQSSSMQNPPDGTGTDSDVAGGGGSSTTNILQKRSRPIPAMFSNRKRNQNKNSRIVDEEDNSNIINEEEKNIDEVMKSEPTSQEEDAIESTELSPHEDDDPQPRSSPLPQTTTTTTTTEENKTGKKKLFSKNLKLRRKSDKQQIDNEQQVIDTLDESIIDDATNVESSNPLLSTHTKKQGVGITAMFSNIKRGGQKNSVDAADNDGDDEEPNKTITTESTDNDMEEAPTPSNSNTGLQKNRPTPSALLSNMTKLRRQSSTSQDEEVDMNDDLNIPDIDEDVSNTVANTGATPIRGGGSQKRVVMSKMLGNIMNRGIPQKASSQKDSINDTSSCNPTNEDTLSFDSEGGENTILEHDVDPGVITSTKSCTTGVDDGSDEFQPDLIEDAEPHLKALEHHQDDDPGTAAGQSMAESLEGALLHRKGKAVGKTRWEYRYVVLNLKGGGSIDCYRFKNRRREHAELARTMQTKVHRRLSSFPSEGGDDEVTRELCLQITADMPWYAKDIDNDPGSFVIEIEPENFLLDSQHDTDQDSSDEDQEEPNSDAMRTESAISESQADDNEENEKLPTNDTAQTLRDELEKDIVIAKARNKPLRFYFKCPQKVNEKALWLRAFTKLDRLSIETRNKAKWFGTVKQMGRSRVRSSTSANFVLQSEQLERNSSRTSLMSKQVSERFVGNSVEELVQVEDKTEEGELEYRVQPSYAYPSSWFTKQELSEEMNAPSLHFHDLCHPSKRGDEIGSLHVEVLQCLGLPKSPSTADTNAVVYCVLGSYAFATDIIPTCSNPMWLRKMRRACVFPIFHAYARMYLGVFDDCKRQKDEYVGRVALELARLRPGCTYDVTLPLRLSTQVYYRRQQGSVRLRFHLKWTKERAAVLSYIPLQRMLSPEKRNEEVTIQCADPKAFRNIAITVHGSHLPGRFSMNQLMGAIREINFAIIMGIRTTMQLLLDVALWKTPVLSLYVFLAWMYAVYANSIALLPVYCLTFVLLLLMRNYARYVILGSEKSGFLPPTLEEIFKILINSSSDRFLQCIDPLDMKQRGNMFAIETHDPWFQELFYNLRFLETEKGMDLDDDFVEFPFSNADDYPKFTVKESLAPSKKQKARIDKQISFDNNADSSNPSRINDAFDKFDNDLTTQDMIERADSMDEYLFENKNPDERDVGEQSSTDVAENERRKSVEDGPVVPPQNIDIKPDQTNDKAIADQLEEVRQNLHKATFNLFDDKSYVIKDPNAPTWHSNGRKKSDMKNDVKRDLDRLLGVGQFSSTNMLLGRIMAFAAPIMDMITIFLSAYRVLFNIFTWRDPFLSFWFSVGCILVLYVLLLFPWRIVIFAIGIVCVGPQNYFLRPFLLKQMEINKQKRLGALQLKDKAASMSEEDKNSLEKFNNGVIVDQPVFQSHAPANQVLDDTKTSTISNSLKGIQHVVVPYSPLNYQRFYDWPPEPEYARVKKGPPSALTVTTRTTKSSDSVDTNDIPPLTEVTATTLRQTEDVPQKPTSILSSSFPSLGQTTISSSSSLQQSQSQQRNIRFPKEFLSNKIATLRSPVGGTSGAGSGGNSFFKHTLNNIQESLATAKRPRENNNVGGGEGNGDDILLVTFSNHTKVDEDDDEDVSELTSTYPQQQAITRTLSSSPSGGETTAYTVESTLLETPVRSGQRTDEDDNNDDDNPFANDPYAQLLEDYMAMKLEIANLMTEKDHYKSQLMQAVTERDDMSAKYNSLLENFEQVEQDVEVSQNVKKISQQLENELKKLKERQESKRKNKRH